MGEAGGRWFLTTSNTVSRNNTIMDYYKVQYSVKAPAAIRSRFQQLPGFLLAANSPHHTCSSLRMLGGREPDPPGKYGFGGRANKRAPKETLINRTYHVGIQQPPRFWRGN
jgi:hypothetical protein